ncbi:MAG: hypothetical protein AB8B64_27240 [Granulosicoccus sp.]
MLKSDQGTYVQSFDALSYKSQAVLDVVSLAQYNADPMLGHGFACRTYPDRCITLRWQQSLVVDMNPFFDDCYMTINGSLHRRQH